MYKPRIGEKDYVRYAQMAQMESEFRAAGYKLIAGFDEAGRGPLAGPVAAAACILDPDIPIYGLNDSKKLSVSKRSYLAKQIKDKALAYEVAFVGAERIDDINILEASKEAMVQALGKLQPKPDLLLLDALLLPQERIPQRAVVKGDSKVNAIAAASILAKTARDTYMQELDKTYPAYGFARHKGYGTKEHYKALEEHGPCLEHRLSFLKKLRLGRAQALSPQAAGYQAEQAVAKHLCAQGFKILEQNFCLPPFTEIDLICQRKNYLYFIEVKARSPRANLSIYEQVAASLNSEKIRKIRLGAKYYLQSRKLEDFTAVILASQVELDEQQEVKHIKFYNLN